MAHWNRRSEPRWKQFKFKQPYAKGLERLKKEVLTQPDFDPATLWQWGTLQATALIEVLKDCEATFGEAGQQLVYRTLRRVGLDVGRQILDGAELPDGITEAEFTSFYATVVNCVVYASLEAPRVDSDKQASFDILWCPHQDHYGPFDCRVQRYVVQGMIDAAKEAYPEFAFDVRFDCTIPAGAPTCHFTLWKASPSEKAAWEAYTEKLGRKALEFAKQRRP